MRLYRYSVVVFLLFFMIVLQSCGGGSGKETNGSLTITNLAVKGPDSGVFAVSETITYNPPPGKVPNAAAVVVTINGQSTTHYLDSTGSFTLTDFVLQTGSAQIYAVKATIGDLESSVATVLPAFAALNATPTSIAFELTDAANTSKTATLAGGVTPYAATVTNSADLGVSIAGTTLNVTKKSLTGAVQKFGTITVTDAAGNFLDIPVSYY